MFKNLKSLFIVDEGGKKKSSTPAKEEKSPTKKANSTAPKNSANEKPVASTSTATPSAGKVTTKFMEILLGAMDKNNLDGFDYLEFKQSLKSLEKMPMDEATKYKSAFAMAQTMGATPDHLVKTATHYINILKQEDQKFKQALANQKGKQIGDKESRIKNLDAIIKNKTDQIKKLEADIKNHQAEMQKMKKEISSSSVKVESTKNDFVASYNSIIAQIVQDVERMKKYLK